MLMFLSSQGLKSLLGSLSCIRKFTGSPPSLYLPSLIGVLNSWPSAAQEWQCSMQEYARKPYVLAYQHEHRLVLSWLIIPGVFECWRSLSSWYFVPAWGFLHLHPFFQKVWVTTVLLENIRRPERDGLFELFQKEKKTHLQSAHSRQGQVGVFCFNVGSIQPMWSVAILENQFYNII